MNTDTDTCVTASLKNDRNHGLGAVLRQLRKGAKVTQAQAAEAMGLERTSVCNIESGTQALTIEKLYVFAEFVGVDVLLNFKPKRRAALKGASLTLGDATCNASVQS